VFILEIDLASSRFFRYSSKISDDETPTLLIQNRLWSADQVIKHAGQATPICQLCRAQPESCIHIIAQCAYSKSVWAAFSSWFGVPLQEPPTNNFIRIKTWWRNMLQVKASSVRDEQERMQKLIYTVWHLWKERCRCVFDNKAMAQGDLPPLIKQDTQLWFKAGGLH
jgi:hypothetical protein